MNASRIRLSLLALVVTATAPLVMSYRTFPGNPRWPLKGGVHLRVNLLPTSFVAKTPVDYEALWAISDWTSIPGCSLKTTVLRNHADYTNHKDGINTWVRLNQPSVNWYALSFIRYSGSTMLEADVWYNINTKFQWSTLEYDPTKERARIDSPLSFRGVARSMVGRSIGLDYESRWLASTNSWYTHGSGVQHSMGYVGMLPHATDRHGARTLYPKANDLETNIMVTAWKEPKTGSGAAQRIWHTGTYAAGASANFAFYLENPGNVSLAAGVSLGLYVSKDDKITTSDRLVRQYSYWNSIGKHGQWNQPAAGKLPVDLAPGTYYLGVIVDNTNKIKERYEADNFACVGKINVTNKPDLVVGALTADPPAAIRGSRVMARFRVENPGFQTAPVTKVHFFLGAQKETGYEPVRTFDLGTAPVPSLNAGGHFSAAHSFEVPPQLCGERNYFLHAFVDPDQKIGELDEKNNLGTTGLRVLWPVARGYWTGGMAPRVSSATQSSLFPICSKVVGDFPKGTYYFFLMTCSGTSPGLRVPGLGTFHLNWDGCTDIGFALFGSVFRRLYGLQDNQPEGNQGSVLGGPWLKPLKGRTLHFTSFYLVPNVGLVGLAEDAVPMGIF